MAWVAPIASAMFSQQQQNQQTVKNNTSQNQQSGQQQKPAGQQGPDFNNLLSMLQTKSGSQPAYGAYNNVSLLNQPQQSAYPSLLSNTAGQQPSLGVNTSVAPQGQPSQASSSYSLPFSNQ